MDKRALVILSGGMDSTTLLHYVKEKGFNIHALTFHYGQRHSKEIGMAAKTCEKLKIPHTIVNVQVLSALMKGSALTDGIAVPEGHYEDESMKLTVVPNRNSLFINMAMSFAISNEIDTIFYGAHAGDHAIYPDCRPIFVKKIKELAKVVHYTPLNIEAPFLGIDKAGILALGSALKVDYSLTWTCYKGEDKPCGKCGSCVERAEAFAKLNIVDPLVKV